MIINYDEHSSQFYQPASYNTNLLNHYNHDVYDKKTICIDLTREIEFDDRNYQYFDSNYVGSSNSINNNTSVKNDEKNTYSCLSQHKNYSSKKQKFTLTSNNQNENSNKINDNCAVKMKKFQSNSNEIIILDSNESLSHHQQHELQQKKQADILNLNDNRQTNEFFSNIYHLNTNSDISTKKYDLNYKNFDKKLQLKRQSNSVCNFYENNINISNSNAGFNASSCKISPNYTPSKSSVEKTKKLCLEANNKTSQLNFSNSFQNNQGMYDKDKDSIGKSLSLTNNLCNCDCFSIFSNNNNNNFKKGHDDFAINNFSNNKTINHLHYNNNHMSIPLSTSSSLNSIYDHIAVSNHLNDANNLDQAVPFKKRSFQPTTLSSIDTNFKAQPSDTYLQPSDNSFNFSKKILTQSNSSLNRQLKPVINNSCSFDNVASLKKNFNSTSTTYSTGLTLPITIINKPGDKATNKTTPTLLAPITTALSPSQSIIFASSIKKDLPTTIVPFKKRNFSNFLDDPSECSTSSLSSTSTQASSTHSEIVSEISITNEKQPTAKKSKEHLLDPNRQKKIKRCPHVWQFCADLLASDNYNPSIIKWLNKDRGIFKIVKPDKVAELWGAQKNRRSDKKMNYEKMARGMRYSRREGFFKKLEKEKNKPNEYGKQLVFQFSEKVVKNFVNFDWKWSFSK